MSELSVHEHNKMIESVLSYKNSKKYPFTSFWRCTKCGSGNTVFAYRCVCGKKKNVGE